MLPRNNLISDGTEEGPRPSDWALHVLAKQIPPWAPTFGGGLAEPQPFNVPRFGSSISLSAGVGYTNGFNLGSWLPKQDTNGHPIHQQPDNRLMAPVNPLKRKLSVSAQEWHSKKQHGERYVAGEGGGGLNTHGFNQISQYPSNGLTAPVNLLKCKVSAAAQEWNSRKHSGESSSALDELMQYQGLEEVKQHFLDIKSKVNICAKQDPDRKMNVLKLERFNAVFQGNPGTGAHTVISACCFSVRLTSISRERQDDDRSIIR
jgi:hypothetical protein